MRLATVAQSQRIDQRAQSEFALPGEVLMEAAGALSAREIEQSFLPELQRGAAHPIVVVCGPGNNGADGLVVARHLQASRHRNVVVVLVAPPEKRSPLFLKQLERCEKQQIEIRDGILDFVAATDAIARARVIVDALFGIGFRGDAKGEVRDVIEAMNASQAPTASLDVPSGLDADRGVAEGPAVRASLTLTFGLAKPGFFLSDGPSHVGRLRPLAIGFPRDLAREEADTHLAFTERMAHRSIPRRNATSHKTDHGHALLIAGSEGMWGASVLCASTAYRMGAGYVTLASHTSPSGPMAAAVPEVLTTKTNDEKLWAPDHKWTAAGIGPGLGTGKDTLNLLLRLKSLEESKVVVDADAITVAAREKIWPVPPSWVITPHAGELARILDGPKAKEIEADRFKFALEAAKLTGATVVLKGFRTVVAQGGRAWVILAGNSALAKAGTGDVLTGMITSLLAQGLSPLRAACTGAYVHGRIADEWVRAGNSRASMEASDIREILPGLLSRLAPGRPLR